MKKDIEVEVNNLESMIKNLSISNDNMKNILKQISIVKKAIVPKKSNRNHNYNSGLQKPLKISKEMADFAGWNYDELHSRVDVTKVVCEYVKNKKIQKESDKRIIMLDKKLKEILHHDGDEITYPHIQKYISIHFIKDEEPKENEIDIIGEVKEMKEIKEKKNKRTAIQKNIKN